jgi:hypothetical protein
MKSTIFWVAVLCSSVKSTRVPEKYIIRVNEQAKQGGLNLTPWSYNPEGHSDSDYGLMVCDTVYFARYVPTFCRNILAPIPESSLKKETAGCF